MANFSSPSSLDDDRQDPTPLTKVRQCLPPTPVAISDIPKKQINASSTLTVEVLGPFTWGGAAAGDCRWESDEVYLYSDGRWLHNHRFRSAADIFGDRIVTRMKVVDPNGYAIASWEIKHGIDPGDDRTDSHQGIEPEISRLWDSIIGMTRGGACE